MMEVVKSLLYGQILTQTIQLQIISECLSITYLHPLFKLQLMGSLCAGDGMNMAIVAPATQLTSLLPVMSMWRELL